MSAKSKEGHHEIGHVVSPGVLLGTFGGLVVLTWVTVAATYIDLGSLNILVAMLIAVVKSALVVLFFMHLKYDKPFHAIIFISAMLFVTLFISLALMDTREYANSVIPGYSPEMDIAAQERAAAAGTDSTGAAHGTPEASAPEAEAAPSGAAAGH